MPKVSRETASANIALEGLDVRFENLDGALPRWGYVISGKVGFRFSDREETYEAGDAYYVPPGHTPVHFAGAELVEFSPTETLRDTISVVMENLQAAGVAVGSSTP